MNQKLCPPETMKNEQSFCYKIYDAIFWPLKLSFLEYSKNEKLASNISDVTMTQNRERERERERETDAFSGWPGGIYLEEEKEEDEEKERKRKKKIQRK